MIQGRYEEKRREWESANTFDMVQLAWLVTRWEEAVVLDGVGARVVHPPLDGQYLLLSTTNIPNTGSDVWAQPLSGDAKPFPLLQTRFDEAAGLSPDGSTGSRV